MTKPIWLNVSFTYIETFVLPNVFLKAANSLKQFTVIKACLSIKHNTINSSQFPQTHKEGLNKRQLNMFPQVSK